MAQEGQLGRLCLGRAHAYRRLSDRRFQEVVLCLLGLSGLTLIWWSLTSG
jgi:hypothetical protein